jgi:hypothetical protein
MDKLLVASEYAKLTINHFYITTELTVSHIYWLDSQQYLRITNAHCDRPVSRSSRCGCTMQLIESPYVSDGYKLQCGKRPKYTQSIRKDSFFFNSKLSIPTMVYIINCLQAGVTVPALTRLINVSAEAINGILRKLQQLMYENQPAPQFDHGDPIEIDEMWFKWKAQPNTGGYLDTMTAKSGNWIVGMVNRQRTAIWMQPIPSRTEGRLFTVIQKYIVPGNVIMTDAHMGYHNLGDWYTHFVINKAAQGFARNPDELHSITRATKKRLRVHVNKIENNWKLLRDLIRLRNAQCNRHCIHLVLAEFIYSNFYKKEWFDLIKVQYK